MTKANRRIELSRVALDGKVAVLFYDVVDGVVIDDLTDFVWSLSDDGQLDGKTVSDAAYCLRRFWQYLAVIGKKIGACGDKDIKEFRDAELKSVMSSSRAKQDERIAKGTVNIRVRLVYRLLVWLQLHGRTPARSIGARGCRVQSTLPDEPLATGGSARTRHDSHQSSRDRRWYPLVFQRVGSKSKHSTKFVPSEKTRFLAITALHETASSDYLAHRNTLLVDIANTVGWRRASINSITLEDVDEAAKKVKGTDYASFSPSVQKFGYVESFDVPAWLVERMSYFVRRYLIPMAEAKGWNLAPKTTKLLLGVNGRPLVDRTVTQIVSKAMRAADAPRWTSLHAFRRKFTNDEISDETRYRLKNGLDTTAASIAASVSISLGHHDPDSIYAYVSRSLSAERSKADGQRLEHLTTLEQQVLALKLRVKELEGDADL